MSKSAMIRARVEPSLKEEAEGVLSELGLSPTQAITLFYKQVTLKRGLPFVVNLPNEETRNAMKDALAGQVDEWSNLEDLMSKHG